MIIVFGMLLTGACVPPGVLDSASTGDTTTDERERTGECAENKDCQEMCKDIFKSRKDREKCEEYSLADVKKINAVFEVLDDPDEDDLSGMNLSDLKFLLGISPDPLENAVGDMNTSEQKDFLAWLATDSEATDIIIDAEKEFKILKKLFGALASEIITALNKIVKSGDSFVEVALEEGNDVALKWLHKFFGEGCEDEGKYEKCVFKKYYCGIDLSSDLEQEYLDQEFFAEMLDEVLESEQKEGYTSDDWGSNNGEWPEGTEAGELDSWKSGDHDVCGRIDPNYADTN